MTVVGASTRVAVSSRLRSRPGSGPGSTGRGGGAAVPVEGVEAAGGAGASSASVVAARVARGLAIAQPIGAVVAGRVVAVGEVALVPVLVGLVVGEVVVAAGEDVASSCWNRAAWSGASAAALAR